MEIKLKKFDFVDIHFTGQIESDIDENSRTVAIHVPGYAIAPIVFVPLVACTLAFDADEAEDKQRKASGGTG